MTQTSDAKRSPSNWYGADAVTLRRRSEAEASKGDGGAWLSSFEARKCSHLRMTTPLFKPDGL